MAVPVGTRLGPYDILAKLGEGGMGEVYRARDTKLDRDVAIKVLPATFANDADRLARFTREAKTLAALNHPNIAHIYGIENNALVMELVEGDDLSVVIARHSTLAHGVPSAVEGRGIPLSDALPIAKQIADALEAAHELGIVHRDLKPANIKVRADGTVKVLDFGLAKAIDPAGGSSVGAMNSPTITAHATQMGMIIGTAAYMAPEQARGKAVDKRADVWAFGVVLYEMLTGRRAFAGEEISDVLAAVLRQDIDWTALPADTPPRLRRLLERCLDRDVKERLRDIGEARVEIAKIQSGAPDSISGVLLATVMRAPAWRRALPWAVAAVAVVGAVIAALIAVQRGRGEIAPVWTSIAAPVGDFGRGSPAVSPDGRTVAFVANNAAGTPMLWVRRLDAQSAREIAATDGASAPFWSPDGVWIGFFKDRKLQKILASGGPAQILADAVNPRGATWSQEGVILFVPAPGSGLHRVPSAGGSVERLTTSDGSAGLSSFPSFLPDGKHFLYSDFRDGAQWIDLGSLDGKPSAGILKASSRAEYSNGYLLFGSRGALYAQRFDVSTLQLSGERIRLVDQLGFGSGQLTDYSFSLSPDTVVTGNRPPIPLSRLTWFDGQGTRLSELGEARHIFGFSVSPDGTKTALEVVDPAGGSSDPWIMQLNSGFTTPMRASAEGSFAYSPIWSRDGERVFYAEDLRMHVASPAGRLEAAWTVGYHWTMSSSPNGQHVLILQQKPIGGNDLMLVSLTGDHTPVPWLQTSFNEISGRFSPDGHSVAYVSNESGQYEVYVQSFPRLGNKRRMSRTGGSHPEWSQDGKTLYFLGQEDGGKTAMMAAAVDSAAAVPRRLFEVEAGQRDRARSQYAVFDNGRRFLISVFVPVTAPEVLTVGLNWATALGKKR